MSLPGLQMHEGSPLLRPKQCEMLTLSCATSFLYCVHAGLPYDRHWMVVRADSGKFLTQRQIPKLCQVCCCFCAVSAATADLW
jgi:hypothetical protein